MFPKRLHPAPGIVDGCLTPPGYLGKKLVEMNVEELKDEHLAWADLVYLSAMLVQSKSAAEIISRCKKSGTDDS